MSVSINTEPVVVIGSGPAAYSAAVYLQDLCPLVLAGEYDVRPQNPGGQLVTTTDVDNYPGFPSGITGPELADRYKEHAEKTGARVKYAWVTRITQDNEIFTLHTKEEDIRALSVVIATGSVAKRLDAKGTGDNELWQKGISACATCDGWVFTDKVVAVIGGGDTAMEEALYLSGIAKRVILIHRTDKFRARPDMLEKVNIAENITVKTWRVLNEAVGEKSLKEIVLEDPRTKEEERIEVDGLFFAVGHTPSTEFLDGSGVRLDTHGYVVTDKQTMETSVPGIFAAGDVQDSRYRQAVTAAYTGMVAGKSCMKFLQDQKMVEVAVDVVGSDAMDSDVVGSDVMDSGCDE